MSIAPDGGDAMGDEQRRQEVAASIREAWASAPDAAARETARARRRRTVLAVTIGLGIAAIVGALGWSALAPRTQPAAIPTPASSPTADPGPAPSVGPPPEIVQVGEDLVANPPERPILVLEGVAVLAATGLGSHAGYSAYGYVTDANEVCIMVETATEGHAACTTYEVFATDGVTRDGGAWSVTWWADGRVEWVGI